MHARTFTSIHTTGHLSVRIVAACLLLCLSLAGCGLESPKAPNWSVEVRVPLAARSFDIPYIVERIDIDEVRWSEDAGVSFHVERVLDSVFVGDNLTVAAVSTQADVPLENIRLATGATSSRTLMLEDLYPGTPGIIAAFSTQTRQSLTPITDIATAAVTGGIVAVTVSNDLGLTLDSVTVSIFNAGSQTPFATIPVGGPIPSGSFANTNSSITPMSIGSAWDMSLAFYTPGGTVLTANDKSVSITVALPEGIQVASGSGVVSAFQYASRDTVSMSSEHTILEAALTNGDLAVRWLNQTPIPLTVDWHTDDITLGQSPLAGSIDIAPFSEQSQTFSLDNYAASLTAHASRIILDATVTSIGSAGEMVAVDASSGVAVETEFSNLVLASGTIALAQTTQTIPTLQASIEWPHGLSTIGLAEGTAILEITSSLPWPASIDGQVEVPGGSAVAFSGIVDAGGAQATATTIDIGAVDALLNPLPQSLIVSGTARYGDGATAAAIDQSDFLVARVIFTAPANLLLDSATVVGDPEPVELAGDEDIDFDGRLLGGEITVDVTNHLPFGTEILISFASDSASLMTAPELVLGPSTITAAVTNSNGEAIDVSTSHLTFVLNQDDVSLFERDSIWVTENLILRGPGADIPARVSLSDYIDWTATAVLGARVGDIDNTEAGL